MLFANLQILHVMFKRLPVFLIILIIGFVSARDGQRTSYSELLMKYTHGTSHRVYGRNIINIHGGS